ncbi:MAG: SRPBCC domain-containing protein [Pseudomonadota bacterium]
MDARKENEPHSRKSRTTVERKFDRELVVTRTINGPARVVFDAWTKPELFKQWWAPRSMGMFLRSCEMDVRVGGKYRLTFGHDVSSPAQFFGTYIDVTPHSRLAWTNEEGGDGGPITTLTFEEKAGLTLLVLHELYPSKEALDAAGTGAADALGEMFDQLDELLVTLGANVGKS